MGIVVTGGNLIGWPKPANRVSRHRGDELRGHACRCVGVVPWPDPAICGRRPYSGYLVYCGPRSDMTPTAARGPFRHCGGKRPKSAIRGIAAVELARIAFVKDGFI